MHLKISSLFFLLFLSFKATALVSPRFNANAPIQIQSDVASFEQRHHQAVHEGNVILTQGTHIVRAAKLTVKKDPKGKETVIKAFGSPATFTGVFDNDPEPVKAAAKIIYYYPDKQLIVLEGEASLDHHQDKFKGPSLSYQIDKQIVFANKQSNERPTITIHPRVSQK